MFWGWTAVAEKSVEVDVTALELTAVKVPLPPSLHSPPTLILPLKLLKPH